MRHHFASSYSQYIYFQAGDDPDVSRLRVGGLFHNQTIVDTGYGLRTEFTVRAPLAALAAAHPGQTIDVNVTTLNQGTRATGPTTTRIWLSADMVLDAGDTLLTPAGVSVLPLNPNGKSKQTVAVTIPPGTPPSKRFLIGQADALSVQAESNEGNNNRAKTITVGPDYLVPALSIVPTSVPAGASFTITDTTRNSGAAVAINTTTRFYLSLDKILSPGTDVLLTQRVVAPLGTGQSNSASTLATMPVGTTPGTKYRHCRRRCAQSIGRGQRGKQQVCGRDGSLRRRPRPDVSPGDATGSNPARCPASTCIARLVS